MSSLRGPHVPVILIVEDMEQLRNLLCQVLSDKYECHTVRSAEEGLALLEQQTIDAVLTDITLPGMSGTEFLCQVREKAPHLPVVVITGGDATMRREDFLSVGAFAYLQKPFRVEEVEATLDRAIEHRHRLKTKCEGETG